MMFQAAYCSLMASQHSFMSVTCTQGEPALIGEKHRVPVANANANRAPWCQAVSIRPPHATFVKSAYDCLVKDIHTSGLLEVILHWSSLTKDQIAVLLMG